MDTNVITSELFERILNDKVSNFLKDRIREKKIGYSELSVDERDYCIRRAVDVILDDSLTKSGKHRQSQWEAGWSENLVEYKKTKNIAALSPKYYGKYDYIRLGGRLVKILDRAEEYKIYETLVEYIFDKYMRKAGNIYEFGCGPGHNIMHIKTLLDKRGGVRFVGLDWASSSQEIFKELNQNGFNDVEGKKFDYFDPDYDIIIPPNTVVFTFASLEQMGTNYKKFLDFLLKNRVELCVNIEPILELMDQSNLLDYLAFKYMEKRNYLNGYLTELRRLEEEGIIEILEVTKTGIGSIFGESASITAWRVK